ncbi:hypothetical protein ACA910_005491 [Epithemia clementina (nom. ined.)]
MPTSSAATQHRNVVLLGRLGHGKTLQVNKMCGTNHASSSGAESCTQTVQYGISKKHEMFVIDTPGIGSSKNTGAHIAAQKVALESIPISGVYVVVKHAPRVDDLALKVEPVMDFLGTDDVRIIVTHADTASNHDDKPDEVARNQEVLRASLSEQLGVSASNIAMFGKDSSGF